MFSRPTASNVGSTLHVLLLTLNTYLNHLLQLDLKARRAAPVVIRPDSVLSPRPLALPPRWAQADGGAMKRLYHFQRVFGAINEEEVRFVGHNLFHPGPLGIHSRPVLALASLTLLINHKPLMSFAPWRQSLRFNSPLWQIRRFYNTKIQSLLSFSGNKCP